MVHSPNEYEAQLWAALALQLAAGLQADMPAFRLHIGHRILGANSPSAPAGDRRSELPVSTGDQQPESLRVSLRSLEFGSGLRQASEFHHRSMPVLNHALAVAHLDGDDRRERVACCRRGRRSSTRIAVRTPAA